MKITRRQLRKIIKETMLNEYGLGDEFDAMRNPDVRAQDKTIPGSIASVDWIKFHHDPYYDTNPPEWLDNPAEELDAFLDLLISGELANVLDKLGMSELESAAMSEIDYEGIYRDGQTIMKILSNVFPNTNQATLKGALKKWAAEHTGSGRVHSGDRYM